MGYRVRASLVYGIPAEEVPQEWLDYRECEDVGEVWQEYSGKKFSVETNGFDGSLENFVGYVVMDANIYNHDELNIPRLSKRIELLDKEPFEQMRKYKPVSPRLFLLCSML